jgi:CheY-like chemotaxis protein
MTKTILLVDDDLDLLHSVAEVLRTSGYSVLEHSNSGEALECFRHNEDLNCILTDIDMPGMDGISLLAEMRRIRPIAEALLMTGNFGRSQLESSEDVQCLRKPFSSGELLQALDHCTDEIN